MEKIQEEDLKIRLITIVLKARNRFDKGEMGTGLAFVIRDLEELLDRLI